MADTPVHVLVLSDQDGTYYLLSRELLDQARVPAEQAGHLKRLVEDGDTTGFAFGLFPTILPPTSFVAAPKTTGKGGAETYFTMTMEGAFITK